MMFASIALRIYNLCSYFFLIYLNILCQFWIFYRLFRNHQIVIKVDVLNTAYKSWVIAS